MGQTVEISVNWPARLDGTCPLKFVAMGKIVRVDAGRAAVRIEKYEFETRGGADRRQAAALTARPDAR